MIKPALHHVSRRSFVKTGGALAAAALLGVPRKAKAAPAANVLSTTVISHEAHNYHGWPTIARTRAGKLLVAWSGGREGHVCPFGRVDYMTSDDGGESWAWPRTLLDSAIDDRDAGVVETAQGSILVTTFTSLAYEHVLATGEKKAPGEQGAWSAGRLQSWRAAQRRFTAEQRKADLGEWMIRSTDGGLTWSARYPSIVNSPHGPIQLADGRLLYAGRQLWSKPNRVGVCESTDDGQSWHWLAEIPDRPGDDAESYHELHATEAADGRIIVHIRNHNKANNDETIQTESTDGGKTWAVPRPIGVWGLPSALTKLRNGNLLMTYGHRRAPLGNQARVSTDHGKTWSEPLMVSTDGTSGDLGYPSTVELDDGTLVTVWYEAMKGDWRAVLRQARWKLDM